jgi:acetolactate synthase I/III small subunit
MRNLELGAGALAARATSRMEAAAVQAAGAKEVKENTISILVHNKPDVLARIAGTFSGRGFNIESISANVTMNPEVTKIVITTFADPDTMNRLAKQLNRLHDILEVRDLTGVMATRREMALVRLKLTDATRAVVRKCAARHGWKLLAEDPGYAVVEITGEKGEIEHALAALAPLGMEDFTRSGCAA